MSFGESRDKGECAEGWVVLNMILSGMQLGTNFKCEYNAVYATISFNYSFVNNFSY